MPLRADLLSPIPGENPSGVNLRYDPVTDKIKEARREDLDVPQGEWKTTIKAADWNQVIKLASEALVKKGKDLQIAVWLVDAHIRKEGFPLLEPGFKFLRDLLDEFWDTLYPEIEDGDFEVRAAPLAWLGSKLEDPLRSLPITSSKLSWSAHQESRLVGYEADANTPEKELARETRIKEGKLTAEQFDEAIGATPADFYLNAWNGLTKGQSALQALSDYCDEKFGESAPSFTKTLTAIEAITETITKILKQKGALADSEAVEEAEEMPVEDFSARPAEPEPALTWEVSKESAGGSRFATDGREAIVRQFANLCRILRTRDPEDPSPYMIVRALRWGELLADAPMINREKLEAPPSSVRIGLKRQAADSDWDRVLETTEAAMALPCGRTWLDVQRYTAMALTNKGYGAAARCVMALLRAVLNDVPDLLDLTLPDDTPAANAETKEWIDAMVTLHTIPYTAKVSGTGEESSDSELSFEDAPSDVARADGISTQGSDGDFSVDGTVEETTLDVVVQPELSAFAVDESPPILDEEPIALAEGTPDIFDQAIEAVKAGNTAEGLGVISKTLAMERTGRARFRRRTQLAHLLMAGGREKIAQPILDQLVSEIEERRLEEWEDSEALAYPLSLMLRCLEVDRDDSERRAQLYAKICKLDPVRALNCSP